MQGRWFAGTLRLLTITALTPAAFLLHGAPAMAQDDDGGGDDDDDGGGGGTSGGGASSGGGSGGSSYSTPVKKRAAAVRKKKAAARKPAPKARNTLRAKKTAARPAQARQIRVIAAREADQIIALGLSTGELSQLAGRGYAVLERYFVSSTQEELIKLQIPKSDSLETAREVVRGINAAALADYNLFYRPNQDSACASSECGFKQMIAWPVSANIAAACASGLRIGMIDTAVNTKHEALKGSSIEVLALEASGVSASGAEHGTAVSALLVGARESRTPGLLHGAHLVAANPFSKNGGDERGDLYALVKALDQVAGRNVSVINMSFSGPQSDLFEKMVRSVAARNVVLVAATGNGGPSSELKYPAGFDEVIAVTAVDRSKRVYRRAVRGPHVDFAAPGVSVWTAASVSGGKAKTGTSFAAPFVTAAAALAKAKQPGLGTEGIKNVLAQLSIDLGAAGKDEVFGHGLVQAGGLCQPAN